MASSPMSPRIRLIVVDAPLLDRLESVDSFNAHYGADVSASLDAARAVVQQGLDFYERAGATGRWAGYLAVDSSSNTVVGSCGFKGDPSPAGDVEIAYFTFPLYEGRGFASGMAAELVRIARDVRTVRPVIAHTLPEPNASTRVLEKTGFVRDGDAVDDEVGAVWRWRRGLGRG